MSDFKPYLDDLRKSLNRSKRTPEDDRDKVFHVHGSVWHRVIAKDQNDAETKFLEKLKKDTVDDLYMQICFVRYDDSPFIKRAMASSGESCMIDQGITQGIV